LHSKPTHIVAFAVVPESRAIAMLAHGLWN
jgi:hypothetical protein